MSNWISWNELKGRWKMRDGELLSYLGENLLPYSDYDFKPIPCPNDYHLYHQKFDQGVKISENLLYLKHLLEFETKLDNAEIVKIEFIHPIAFDAIDSICDIFKSYNETEDLCLNLKEFEKLKKVKDDQREKLRKIEIENHDIVENDPDCNSWKYFIKPSASEDIKNLISNLKENNIVFKCCDVVTIENRSSTKSPSQHNATRNLEKKEPLRVSQPTVINWPPTDIFSHNPTDPQIGLESIFPEPGKTIEYYIDGWGWNDNYYLKNYQKKISKEAQRIKGIRLCDLVFILANDKSYNEFLPDLWEYTGFNDDQNDRFPNWKPSMVKNQYIRAHVWYWLLCGWTIYDEYKGDYPAKSYYFGKIEEHDHIRWERKIRLLNLYRFVNGQFEKVKDSEVQDTKCYIKLDEFETYIKKIDSAIPLPIYFSSESHDILNLIKRAKLEIEILYGAVREIGFTRAQGDKDWQKAALEKFQESKDDFTLIKKKFLEDDDLYLFAVGKERRDFVGKILQKILVDNNLPPGDYQKLYKKFKKLAD